MTLVIAVILAGMVAGLIANRFLRQHIVKDDDEGPAPQDILTSVEIFAALLIAIVLVDASVTYSTARNAAADEANVVDNMFESTGYLKEQRFKVGLQSSCATPAPSAAPSRSSSRAGATPPIASPWSCPPSCSSVRSRS